DRAGAADLADVLRVLRDPGQPGTDDGLADAGGMFDHAFIGHRVDGGDGGRAGQRVTRVGQSAGVDAFGEGLEDRVVDDHPAQRHIPGVHALGEGDEVGDDVEVLEGE